MKTRAKRQNGRSSAPAAGQSNEQTSHGGLFAWLAALACMLAVISLSSCTGLTSAHTSAGGTPGIGGAGILTPSTNKLSYSSTAVGRNSTQTLTFTNTGTAAVNIESASVSGAGFTATNGSPLSVIGVGQSGTLQVKFAPPAPGVVTGSLSIVSDAANGPLMITLSGMGTQPGLTISPAALNFGNVTVGHNSTQTVVLTNSGNVDVGLNLATLTGSGFGMSGLSFPTTLIAGQSVSLNVQFSPTTAGGVTGGIVFTDNAPDSPQTLLISGSGVAANTALVASPGSFSFGSVPVSTSSAQSISLINNGSTSITISHGSASGTGFSMSGLALSTIVPPGLSTSFTALFAPAATGTATGAITITSNASNPTVTIPLSGIGTQGNLTANPASVVFGNLAIGNSSSLPVTVTNTGSASVVISQSSATGAGFNISGLAAPLTLKAGQGVSFTATFSPSATGTVNGNISITSNAPGSPLMIPMTGTGSAVPQPQLSATPSSASFGNVTVGNTNTQTIKLSNAGNASVTITQANTTGSGFSTTGLSMPKTIAAGGSTTFNAVFAPTSAGAVNGSVTLVSNSTTSPLVISLSGTGSTQSSHTVALSWDASTTSGVTGYFVYRGTTTGGPYTKQNLSADASLSFTDSALLSGQTYYYVVTAVDSSAVESAFSNQVSATIP